MVRRIASSTRPSSTAARSGLPPVTWPTASFKLRHLLCHRPGRIHHSSMRFASNNLWRTATATFKLVYGDDIFDVTSDFQIRRFTTIQELHRRRDQAAGDYYDRFRVNGGAFDGNPYGRPNLDDIHSRRISNYVDFRRLSRRQHTGDADVALTLPRKRQRSASPVRPVRRLRELPTQLLLLPDHYRHRPPLRDVDVRDDFSVLFANGASRGGSAATASTDLEDIAALSIADLPSSSPPTSPSVIAAIHADVDAIFDFSYMPPSNTSAVAITSSPRSPSSGSLPPLCFRPTLHGTRRR